MMDHTRSFPHTRRLCCTCSADVALIPKQHSLIQVRASIFRNGKSQLAKAAGLQYCMDQHVEQTSVASQMLSLQALRSGAINTLPKDGSLRSTNSLQRSSTEVR